MRDEVAHTRSRRRHRDLVTMNIEKMSPALLSIVDETAISGTAADTAYTVLRRAIVEGVLKPGFRVRADELAKVLGVSKTPVREALRKLEAEELIHVQPRGGLVVSSLSEAQLLEIYYIREALEGMAARLAAETANPIELSMLKGILDEFRSGVSVGDDKLLRIIVRKFWLKVYEASRNTRLIRLLLEFQQQVDRFGRSTMSSPGRAEEVEACLNELIKAFERRDAEGAERIVRSNRRRTLEIRMSEIGANVTT